MEHIGWDQSAEAWIRFVDEGDPHRTHLLDPVMLDLCGDVRGRRALDVGAGEGRFSRMLAARGARVAACDPTRGLIEAAAGRGTPGPLLASAERLPFGSGSFDLVVSYLQLIDVGDFRAAIAEMARVAAPGGRLVVANLNGFCTTSPRAWVRGADGARLHVAVDHYLDERPVEVDWSGIRVVNHHRPLEAYMEAFLRAGLTLRRYLEPAPTPSAAAQRPHIADNLRVPFFNAMVWER